jgi:hypothetical protein
LEQFPQLLRKREYPTFVVFGGSGIKKDGAVLNVNLLISNSLLDPLRHSEN